MPRQPDLFASVYGAQPPHVDTDTSLAAATSIAGRARSMRARVLTTIQDCGARGATDEELERRLKMLANTVRPRRRELCLASEIRDSGLRRKTRSGRDAIVWIAAHVGCLVVNGTN